MAITFTFSTLECLCHLLRYDRLFIGRQGYEFKLGNLSLF